jgi:hypothetical protein
MRGKICSGGKPGTTSLPLQARSQTDLCSNMEFRNPSVPRGTLLSESQAKSAQVLVLDLPTAMIRSLLNGNLTCSCHVNPPPAPFCIERTSDPLVIIMIQPERDTRCDAVAIAVCIRSTARRTTQSKGVVRFSALSPWTLVFSSRVRTASLRNAAFLFWDSAKVTEISGRHSAIGIPGRPAPEPKSSSVRTSRGMATAHTIDSTKWRERMSSSSRIAVRLVRAFQRTISDKYASNRSSIEAESAGRPSCIRRELRRRPTARPPGGGVFSVAVTPE